MFIFAASKYYSNTGNHTKTPLYLYRTTFPNRKVVQFFNLTQCVAQHFPNLLRCITGRKSYLCITK